MSSSFCSVLQVEILHGLKYYKIIKCMVVVSSKGLTVEICCRNGHMLTHRNKKPYECKAEGCGKSYCDARSLRRHTENHHSGSGSVASSSTSPAPASPLAASCIQYAPPPSAKNSPSQLQRLLASEPASSPTTTNTNTKVRDIMYNAGTLNVTELTTVIAGNHKVTVLILRNVCSFLWFKTGPS